MSTEERASSAGDAAEEVLLSIRNLSIDYVGERPVRAVDDLSLELRRGEVFGLLGESGSGKSTAALGALRLLPPPAVITAGEVWFEGRDLLQASTAELQALRFRRISVVLQSAMNALSPVLTIGEQVADVILAHEAVSPLEARAKVDELLELVGISRTRTVDYPHQFSGGMKQRVGIAMALALRPSLVVLDEPTTALDVLVQREILEQLISLKKKLGFSVLLVSHDVHTLLEVCDRLGVLRRGRLCEVAAKTEVLEGGRHPYTRALLDAVPTFGTERRHHPSAPQEPGTLQQPNGPKEPTRSAQLLEVRHLSKTFSGRGAHGPTVAVDDVSFELAPGEVVALVGQSGSGKSTILRMLSGLEPPSSGEVSVRGTRALDRSRRPTLEFRRQVQIVLQDPFASLNPVHTVGHHLERALRLHGKAASRAERRARQEALLESVGLNPAAEFLGRRPHELSGGQRQRVAIARALAAGPDVILADEPTSMLDVSVRLGVLDLLADLKRERGLSFVYVTHDLVSARYVSDRLLVLQAGRVVESGPTEQVIAAPAHPYTRQLLAAVAGPLFRS